MAKTITSNQVRGFRRVQSVAIVGDNTQQQFDLPRGPAIESLFVRVFGSVVITTSGASVHLQAPLQLLKRLDWTINGSIVLDSIAAVMGWINWMRHNLVPLVPPSAATTGTYAISGGLFLDRAMTDGVRPKDSLLKTDVGMSSNQLRVQMGALTDMFIGASTVANYSGGITLEVNVKDYQEARDAKGNTPTPAYYLKRTELDYPLPSTTTNFQIKLSTGNRLRAVLFRPNVSVSNGGPYNDTATGLINNVRLTRAGDVRADIQYNALALLNGADCPTVFSANTNTNGVAFLDLADNGLLSGTRYSEFWPIPSTADTYLVLDVNGAAANNVSLMTIEGVDLTPPK